MTAAACHRAGRPARSTNLPRSHRNASVVPATVLLVLLAGGLLLGYVSGTRVETVSTASMGTSAPVGSLLVTRPVAPGAVHVGEVIVFHPPGQPHTTFVHRVVSVTPGPRGPLLRTRGDLSGSVDPWVLSADEIIGRTVTILPAVGWLLRMLPWFALGVLVVGFCTAGLRADIRRAARILGAVLVAILVLRHFHPLVDIELVSEGPSGAGDRLSGVPTGIMPIRVAALHYSTGAAHADPGQLFTTGDHRATGAHLAVDARPWLHGWWWLMLTAWVLPLAPALWTTRSGATAAGAADDTANVAAGERPDRPAAAEVSPAGLTVPGCYEVFQPAARPGG